jgi:hypothetical protein
MAKLTVGQKAERVLKLLLGLRNGKIAGALVAHGFTDEDLAEGWALLQKITRTKLDSVLEGPTSDPSARVLLDRWENKWFPIAQATLQRRAPEVKEWMFQNIAQSEGAAMVLSVSVFLKRWEDLAKSKEAGGYGPGGKEAREMLEQRGFKQAVIDEARALLERLRVIGPLKIEEQSPSFEEAEKELWGWYLEWSKILRIALQDRKLLRQLGFLKPSSGKDKDKDEDEDENKGEGDEAEDKNESQVKVEKGKRPKT